MSLSNDIKDAALNMGYCKVGITTADDFEPFMEELLSRGDQYDYWTHGAASLVEGASPRKTLPSAKSIIVTAFDYMQKSFPEKLLPMIGRAYLSRTYLPKADMIHGARIELFKQYLESLGCTVAMNRYLPLRPAAMRAGVMNFGRNNFAYVDGIGSFVILYAFMVDKELEYDDPTPKNTCPKGCTACMDACPTQAIYAPFRLNPRRCVGFNNWMRQDGRGESLGAVAPVDIREKLGIRVHGCDICQEVCPGNRAKLKARLPRDEFLEIIAKDFSLDALLHMPEGFHRKRVYPVMYNYINEPKYFQRNAAIAIGNTGDEAYVPALITELANPEPLVRRHVAWALGKIGGGRAKQALEKSLLGESDAGVAQEIRLAQAMAR